MSPNSIGSTLMAGLTLPFLGEVVAILVAGVILAYVCNRIRLVPIVGFLLAGIAIGPTALGLVSDGELINGLAEVGVILLLFTIGVEFSLEKLARIRHLILYGGGLQVVLTVALVAGALVFFGVSIEAALFTGCLVALSSTAIVLTLLSDRAETEAPHGRLSLAILIFQDLAIIVMVLLVTAYGGDGTTIDVAIALLEALALIILVLIAARKAVPFLLERIAATRKMELFLPTVVTICLGTAWITNLAGVSLALGAFLAGLVVSESRYSEHALSEILPLKTLFNAAFFVSVGMLLDLRFVLANLWLVVGAAMAVLLLKLVVTTASVLVIKFPMRVALTVGLGLAQIGEFSFVLERTGQSVGLYPGGLGGIGTQTFIAVTVLLMALTPALLSLAPMLGSRISRMTGPWSDGDPPDGSPALEHHVEDHVVIAGYGPAGQRLVTVMRDLGLPYVIVELDPKFCADAESAGLPVIQGDATRTPILSHAGILTAKLCVVVVSDEAATLRIVQMVRYLNPTVQIIARTRFFSQVPVLHEAGADIVIPEELETSVRLFTHVLNAYMIAPDEINRQVTAIRSGDYQVFRGSMQEAHMMVLQGLDEEGLHTRAVAVREGASVAHKTLKELHLRQSHNLSVLAIRRGTRTIGNPAGDFKVLPGDRLILVGAAADFVNSADLFRSQEVTGGTSAPAD